MNVIRQISGAGLSGHGVAHAVDRRYGRSAVGTVVTAALLSSIVCLLQPEAAWIGLVIDAALLTGIAGFSLTNRHPHHGAVR
jgi:hypothetical protein